MITWGSQAVKHPTDTNWLQFLLQWPSARVELATKIPKLVWPCGHIDSLEPWPHPCAPNQHVLLSWVTTDPNCTAKPSASSTQSKCSTTGSSLSPQDPDTASSRCECCWHSWAATGLCPLLALEHWCGVLPNAKCLIQNKSRQDCYPWAGSKALWVSEIIQFTLLFHHQCCSKALPGKTTLEQNGLQLHRKSNIHLLRQLSPLSLCTAPIQPEAELSVVKFQNLLLFTDVSEAIKAFHWGRCLHTRVSKWFGVFKAKWANTATK